jgi:uncharacterized membrane protein
MNYNYKQTNLSKALFGGLFAGLIASVATEIYNALFRYMTGFQPSDRINVEILIFEPILFCVIAGIFYFIATKFLNAGKVIYTVLFLLITAGLICLGLKIQIEGSDLLIQQFRELHTGVILIIGVIATFVLPYVTKHDVLNE